MCKQARLRFSWITRQPYAKCTKAQKQMCAVLRSVCAKWTKRLRISKMYAFGINRCQSVHFSAKCTNVFDLELEISFSKASLPKLVSKTKTYFPFDKSLTKTIKFEEISWNFFLFCKQKWISSKIILKLLKILKLLRNFVQFWQNDQWEFKVKILE